VSRLRVPPNSVCVCVLARKCEAEEVRIALIPLHVSPHRNAVDGADCINFESDLCLSCFDECHGIRIVDRLGEEGATWGLCLAFWQIMLELCRKR
jgi:hypothetical protein